MRCCKPLRSRTRSDKAQTDLRSAQTLILALVVEVEPSSSIRALLHSQATSVAIKGKYAYVSRIIVAERRIWER